MLEEHGVQYLETWQVPQLTWAELQELKAQHAQQQPAIEDDASAGAAPPDLQMHQGCTCMQGGKRVMVCTVMCRWQGVAGTNCRGGPCGQPPAAACSC